VSFSGASVDDLQAVLRQPGRLVVSPTSFTGSFPFGGTSLGAMGAPEVDMDLTNVPMRCSDEQHDPYDRWYSGVRSLKLTVEFYQSSDDVLRLAYLGGLTEASEDRRKAVLPGTQNAGPIGETQGVALLFVPDDQKTGLAVLFRNVVPAWDKTQRLRHSRVDMTTWPIVFDALRNYGATDAEAIFVMDRLEDLVCA
jgi:hypothetical protein